MQKLAVAGGSGGLVALTPADQRADKAKGTSVKSKGSRSLDLFGGGPGSSGSSSSSDSSDQRGKGRKDKGEGIGSSSSSSSSSSDSEEDPFKKEKKLMRVKGYDTLKIPAIPKNAAEARGFRNAIFSSITKLAKGDESKILAWIGTTQHPHDQHDFANSGNYPLLDRILGHRLLELCKGTRFSLDFQALQENAQKVGEQPKGRLLLWHVFQRFKMDKDTGTALTQHHLLSVLSHVLHGNDVKALEEFRQRFNYIWEALEIAERPTEASIRSLLFEQLKAHPKMQLHIDRFRNASSQSSKRTWKWLYTKMCDVIEISQLEDNADAIDKAFRPKGQANANAAPKAEGESAKTKKEKEKEKKEKEDKEKRTKKRKRRRRKRRKPGRRKRKRKSKPRKQPKRPPQQHHQKAKAKAMASPRVLPKPKRKRRNCHVCSGPMMRAQRETNASISTIRITFTRALNPVSLKVHRFASAIPTSGAAI